MDRKDKIIVFGGKSVRRVWQDGKWFFSVVDVVEVLTESSIPKRYWSDLKIKLGEEGFEAYDKIVRLKLVAEDGKFRETDCADTETIFRIIQSIPSKNAEPFKLWLAKVGYERVREIEDPELAQERMKVLYEMKGYSKDWIDKRLRGIAIRQDLTEEWKSRGVDENVEYAILTNEISKATFGKTVGEYKELKGLDRENLRDHMDADGTNSSLQVASLELVDFVVSELELIFGMLGEKVATEITISKDAGGFDECAVAARQGGEVAGNARREAEDKIGRTVVSEENYLDGEEKKKKKRKLKVEVENE